MPTSPRPRPLPLTVAAAIVGLQGLLIALAGAYLAVAGLAGNPSSVANAEISGALALLAGAGLLLVGYGLSRGRSWGRAPAVLTQILCLPVAWGMVQGGRPDLGVPLIAVAVTTLVLLLLPATAAALQDGRSR